MDRVRGGGAGRAQRGQSLVEFGVSSIVLLLVVTGLLDLSRVFYFDVGLHGAAREGARHGAWFDPGAAQNPYLDDADIKTAVDQALAGSGLQSTAQTGNSCLAGSDAYHNPPFAASAYPTSTNAPYLYICYARPSGSETGSLSAPPAAGDNSWRLGEVRVFLLMSYGLVTGFLQNQLGLNAFRVSAYQHLAIQGR